jgi:metal-sulfur cluster biosynthetic enzyme
MSQDSGEKITWTAENTHPDLVTSLKEALREVIDPEIGLNIIELGFGPGCSYRRRPGQSQYDPDHPFCPYGPAMLEMTRQKAESVLERPTYIEMGHEMWEPSMMEEGAGADWGLF